MSYWPKPLFVCAVFISAGCTSDPITFDLWRGIDKVEVHLGYKPRFVVANENALSDLTALVNQRRKAPWVAAYAMEDKTCRCSVTLYSNGVKVGRVNYNTNLRGEVWIYMNDEGKPATWGRAYVQNAGPDFVLGMNRAIGDENISESCRPAREDKRAPNV